MPFCAPRNPVDATAQVSNDVTLINKFTDAMIGEGGYASVLGFFSMTASSRRWPSIREQLNLVKAKYPDRLYVLSVITPPDRRARTGGRRLGGARGPDARGDRDRGDGPLRRGVRGREPRAAAECHR